MRFSTEELRQRLATQQWTSCNIRLNVEVSTRHHQDEFLTHNDRLQALMRTFSILYPEIRGLRIADLGSSEGCFALALALKGANVVSIEARAKEIEKATLLKEHFEL